MAPRLSFIGLGLMGKPMAVRLLEAGYTVAVHNRSGGAVHELAPRGAIACTSGRVAQSTWPLPGLCYTPLIFSAVHSPYYSQREERVPGYRQAAAEETQPAALAGSTVPDARTGSHPPHVRHSEYRCIQVFARH